MEQIAAPNKIPWWHRLVMFLAYWGPLSVLVLTVGEMRSKPELADLEKVGKRGIVLFIAQVAIFLVCSVALDNAYWQVEMGAFPAMWVAAALCAFLSLLFGVTALFGLDLHFPEPFETWANNLKI
jgi:hypothetical protein